MLKTGIYGADTDTAGELIRLLVNHPDTDITQLYAPSLKGEDVSARHHGLLGERPLKFTDRIDTHNLDVLFICRRTEETDTLLLREKERQESGDETGGLRKRELRVIDLTQAHITDYRPLGMEYGLSEINRKPLVRGARRGVVPLPQASLALVSLYPLAAHLLLSGDLEIEFDMPASAVGEWEKELAAEDIRRQLSAIQASYSAGIRIKERSGENRRTMRMSVEIPCGMKLEEIEKLYDGIYDDHNFTWTQRQRPDEREVEGTQKCIIGLMKPDAATLRIDSVADCRMRGGAGEAVHLMNLLCGLHERTGLRVKSSAF